MNYNLVLSTHSLDDKVTAINGVSIVEPVDGVLPDVVSVRDLAGDKSGMFILRGTSINDLSIFCNQKMVIGCLDGKTGEGYEADTKSL